MNYANNRPARRALTRVSLALSLVFSVAAVAAQTTSAADPAKGTTDEPQKLEKYEVTGSRISRTDAETPSPVVRFQIDSIQSQGYTSLGEFVQRLPFNSGNQASIIQTASFTRGATTANPRGLGSQRFLVLIDGRRPVTYPLTTGPQTLGYNVSVFDFNSIPLGAIEAFEFEKDGASAVYGSDAVTGVLNVKLKKNYQGLTTDYFVENSTEGHDILHQNANLTAGMANGKTQVMVSLSWTSQNASYIRDYDRSSSTDYSRFGDTNKGSNLNSSANWPANLTLSAAQATAAGFTTGAGSYVLTGGAPTANPTKAMFAKVASIPNANRYDFAQTYQLIPDLTYSSAFVNLNHEFNQNLSGFVKLLMSDNSTKYSFTPSVIQSTQNPGTSTSGTLNLPATNPYNPFGVDLNNFLYRTNFGPARKFDTDTTSSNALFGLKGSVAQWDWELGATYGVSRATSVSRNQIRASDLQAALNGTTRSTALNPFGPSDNADVVNKLFTVSNSAYKAWGQAYDGSVSGKLFDMPNNIGEVGIAVGGELRNDYLQADPDTASYVGSGGGTPFKGSRRQYSAYVEVNVPVFKMAGTPWFSPMVEVQGAGRFEHYSDFGSTSKPKFAAKFRVNDWLVFRGSFSKSFKAPDLGTLFTAQTVAFSGTVLTDPKRPDDPATQLRIVSGGNPKLQPEDADTYYAGVLIDMPKSFPGWLKGLELSVDYFQFNLKNLINTPSSTTVLRLEDQLPGSVVRDNSGGAPGPIQYLNTVPFNIATQKYQGFDLELHYRIRNTRVGDFDVGTTWTRIEHLKIDYGFGGGEFDNVGFYNNPKWNGHGFVSWAHRTYGGTVSMDYTGGYWNDAYTVAGWDENPILVTNLNFYYDVWKDIRVTVGVRNVLNVSPPFNGRETSSFDQATYGWMSQGRTAYIQIKKDF